MERYDAVVIGAGVGGIFCAYELSRKGKKVLLLEQQPVAGGYATTFKRKGFTFESAIHCVDSLDAKDDMGKFFIESALDKKVELIALKNFARIIFPQHDFTADFNHDNFVNYLKANFPADTKDIEKLFKAFDKFYWQFDTFRSLHLPQWIKFLLCPFIFPSIIITSALSARQFIEKYTRNEKIIALIASIWGFLGLPPKEASAFYFLLIFRGYYYKPTCYIKGSFSRLFEVMIEEMLSRGAQVKFNTLVTKINTDKNRRVKSVVTDKGEEFLAKTVVSNANAVDTLTKLIDDEPLKKEYQKILSGYEKSISAVQVYLGLKVPAKSLGMDHSIFAINNSYSHEESYRICLSGDYEHCGLELLDHAQVESGLVPAGKGSLVIITFDSYGHWAQLSKEEYKNKKEEVAKKLIARAETYLPGLAENIEVMEVATPLTMQRYSLSPEGAIYGFAQTVRQSSINRLGQKTRIKGLFLSGAWTRPGAGVHACFVSAIDAANLVLKFLS